VQRPSTATAEDRNDTEAVGRRKPKMQRPSIATAEDRNYEARVVNWLGDRQRPSTAPAEDRNADGIVGLNGASIWFFALLLGQVRGGWDRCVEILGLRASPPPVSYY
jgi:hypothetical protein